VRLTDHQLQQMGVVANLLDRGLPAVTLTGSAGTGKTTLLQAIANAAVHPVLAAPTNKAARVLADKTGLEASTVHRIFGLLVEEEFGAKKTTQKGLIKIPPDALMIIDEASMLSEELFRMVCEIRDRVPGLQVLFVGDPYQLNPVGEGLSAALSSKIPGGRLTQVVRQAEGNPIIDAASRLRDAQTGAGDFRSFEEFRDGSHIRIAPNEYAFRSRFLDLLDPFNLDACRAVAWTNARCTQLNRMARDRLFGKNAPEYCEGETVVCFAPIKRKDDRGHESVVYNNGDELNIVAIGGEEDKAVYVSCKSDNWAESSGDESRTTVLRLAKNWDWYKTECDKLATIAKQLPRGSHEYKSAWREFYTFRNSFDDARHCYAVTAHKSQGSTYDRAFVDVENIRRNPDKIEMLRSLYVAVTRAKSTAYLNGA